MGRSAAVQAAAHGRRADDPAVVVDARRDAAQAPQGAEVDRSGLADENGSRLRTGAAERPADDGSVAVHPARLAERAAHRAEVARMVAQSQECVLTVGARPAGIGGGFRRRFAPWR